MRQQTAWERSPLEEFGLWKRLHDNEQLALHAACYTSPASQMQPGWVLDLGSEYGFGSLLISRANPALRVLAVDIDHAALRYSKGIAPNAGIFPAESSALTLPIASESLTGVFIIHLLHLLDEPGGALQESWRVLRSGGLAVLAIPRANPPDGATNDVEIIEQLKQRIQDRFSSMICPDEILGHIMPFAPTLFHLRRNATVWLAICRKE